MEYKIKEETLESIADAIRVKNKTSGSIQVEQFAQSILGLDVGENTEKAAESAKSAAASAASAESSATAAAESAGQGASSESNALASEKAAAKSEENAAASEIASAKSESNAEAWAIGTRNNTAVTSEDETYQNNSKYWAEYAKNIVVVEDFTEDDIQTAWDSIFTT